MEPPTGRTTEISRTDSFRLRALQAYVTCIGLGFISKAPGTVTSLVATVFWTTLIWSGFSRLLYSSLVIIFFVVGVWTVRWYEKIRRVEDSSEITIDEWVGMGISLLGVGQSELWLVLLAFVSFRFFDIAKPLGIKWFDKNYLEGWGVMLDDVLAGIYTAILIGVVQWLKPLEYFASK